MPSDVFVCFRTNIKRAAAMHIASVKVVRRRRVRFYGFACVSKFGTICSLSRVGLRVMGKTKQPAGRFTVFDDAQGHTGGGEVVDLKSTNKRERGFETGGKA